jgi:hypothetical protein
VDEMDSDSGPERGEMGTFANDTPSTLKTAWLFDRRQNLPDNRPIST